MRLPDGRRVDSAAGNRHDQLFERDYDLLMEIGVLGVRESLRWHRMAPRAGDLHSVELLDRLRALERRGMRALWSLTQFGLPDWVDVWSESFPSVFAEYARRVAALYRENAQASPVWSPINEISYWAWAAANGSFEPNAAGRGDELKRQLVRAVIAASRALREVDPACRLVQIDPVVNIVVGDGHVVATEQAGAYEAWDMLCGRLHPELGGSSDLLDIVGINFYPHNQRMADGTMIAPDHPQYVPFHLLLAEVAARYRRPLLVAETGTEGVDCADWLTYVSTEMQRGLGSMELAGLCLYPVLDYPGWVDDRHCTCGAIGSDGSWETRWLHPHMREVMLSTRATLGHD